MPVHTPLCPHLRDPTSRGTHARGRGFFYTSRWAPAAVERHRQVPDTRYTTNLRRSELGPRSSPSYPRHIEMASSPPTGASNCKCDNIKLYYDIILYTSLIYILKTLEDNINQTYLFHKCCRIRLCSHHSARSRSPQRMQLLVQAHGCFRTTPGTASPSPTPPRQFFVLTQ